MLTAENLVIALFVLLPGYVARQTTLRTTPEPWSASYRSTLQELLDVLLYSTVNAMITSTGLAVLGVAFFGAHDDLIRFIAGGVDSFGAERRIDVIRWAAVYFAAALIVAEVTGSSRLWPSARVFLSQLFVYGDAWTHSTIWYFAIEAARERDANLEVAAHVVLQNGTEYLGLLAEYPVIEDDKRKDFVLIDASCKRPEETGFAPLEHMTHVVINSDECRVVEFGPNKRPPERKPLDLSQLAAHGTVWSVVLLVAILAHLQLRALSSSEAVIVLLQLASLWAGVSALFALLRMLMRDLVRRWQKKPTVQFPWLLSWAASLVATALYVAGTELLYVPLAVLALIAFVVFLFIGFRQESQ